MYSFVDPVNDKNNTIHSAGLDFQDRRPLHFPHQWKQKVATMTTLSWWQTAHGILSKQLVPCNQDYAGTSRPSSLEWRHNKLDGVSNHWRLGCLLKRLFRRRSKKKEEPRVTGLCEGNLTEIGGLPSQRASNAENFSIWWRHHVATVILPASVWLPLWTRAPLQYKYIFLFIRIPIIRKRWCDDRFICIITVPIPVRRHGYILAPPATAPET